MDINLENWNTQNIIHTSNEIQEERRSGPLVLERLSEAVFDKTRTGKWEGVGGRTGEEKGAYGTFREWEG